MEHIFTERAHLMCPHMNFGIALSVSSPFDEAGIRETAARLSDAHPFLNALLGYEEEGNVYGYRITESPKTELLLKDREIAGINSPEIMEEYRRLTARDWDLFGEGMLKIAAWPAGEETCFLLVFHHLLADGRGALGLAEELADSYVQNLKPKYAPEKLISSADDFPRESRMPFISRVLIDRANKTQAKEQRTLSYREYHAFADEFLKSDAVGYTVSRLPREDLDAIRDQCRRNGVTVNDYLLAKMMIGDRTEKVIMACDLRNRLGCYNEGALGIYSTAFSVEVKSKETDPFVLAGAVHEQVQKIMNRPADLYLILQCYANLDPAVLDAAFISCRGDYPDKAGKFIGSMFFGFEDAKGYSITNLGSVESGSITSAFFIPPASPAVRKIQGILTVNGVMTVCTAER